MSVYVTYLLYAIPLFAFFVFVEHVAAKVMGIKINRAADMISSLSSGLTNTSKDAIKFGVVLIGYSSLVENMTIYKVENLWIAIPIAFLVQDFSGYWLHRMNHRVNIFWNRHVIHHSSEEFNLSCGLRQSISIIFKFAAILFVPAALMGIDPMIFAVLGPIHLFMQFWYHTRLIGNLGFLEHIIVTPSHHRVHHAINPEYLDRNFGQILIVWDKMFGTFQSELKTSEPVYGILRPAKTWNPILINFKHTYQLCKDAWRAESYYDKLRIWFMPTGWRPDDVSARYPIKHIDDPRHQVKYDTDHSNIFIIWSWFQFGVALIMMLHMFTVVHNYSGALGYMYVGLIFAHIFSFTTLLDGRKYGVFAELVKVALATYILLSQSFNWYGLNVGLSYFICIYLALSLSLTIKKIK
tara:strand:+ start:853 stop:2079 length:1227 start_codon:yes stop_codon:yes gene_type:complete